MPEQQPLHSNARPGSALDRFFQLAPYFPRCSSTNDAGLSRPRELAFRYPYMQVNRTDMVSWLVFDLDDHASGYSWEDANLPPPNLIVRNRNKPGSAHWYYAIVPVNTGPNGRDRPVSYMRAVYNAMKQAIEPADPSYGGGPVAKTPGHPFWETTEVHADVYDLGELADYVDVNPGAPWKPRGDRYDDCDAADSRHVWLFHYLRFRAYRTVEAFRDRRDYQAFHNSLLRDGLGANNFTERGWAKGNLTSAQVRATVKSVSRWTWDHYTGSGRCARGVMQLDDSLPLSVRQTMAARRTHAERQSKSQQRVEVACHRLLESGVELSFAAIARESGLSRQTVAKHRQRIRVLSASSEKPTDAHSSRSLTTDAEKPSKALCRSRGSVSGTRVVNFAVDQITTGHSAPTHLSGVIPFSRARAGKTVSCIVGRGRGNREPPDP